MYIPCVAGVDGDINPSGFIKQGGDEACFLTVYAALRPLNGFSYQHQQHMHYTYNSLTNCSHRWYSFLVMYLLITIDDILLNPFIAVLIKVYQ